MKVILLQDVAKVGRKNEVKEVNDGFARNFLIGQGRAVIANPINLAKVEEFKKSKQGQQLRVVSSAQQFLDVLGEGSFVIKAKANKEGGLFASIHEKEIVSEIKKQFNLDLPVNLLALSKPIKETGENKIALKLGDSVRNISILVEAF